MDLKDVIATVAKDSQDKEKKAEETVQIVVFVLDKEEYGIDINALREIIKTPAITPVPGVPSFVSGILNLRGKIVVVIDLEKRFNLTRDGEVLQKHIVITEQGENNFGILVDQVFEVLRIPVSQIQAAPTMVSSKIHADYLKGVAVLGERLILLLDLPKLLSENELLKLGEEINKYGN